MKITFAQALLLGAIPADIKAEKKCVALAMSGGGSLGAYEAGALWGIYNTLEDKSDMEYDVVTGVSAGSINTIGVSVFAKGDEKAMVEELSHRWSHLSVSDMYVQWKPLGILTGVNKKSGIFDDSPLYKYLDDFVKAFGNKFQRKFVLSAVDVNTGAYVKYDETCPDPAKAATSSASIPFVFSTQ